MKRTAEFTPTGGAWTPPAKKRTLLQRIFGPLPEQPRDAHGRALHSEELGTTFCGCTACQEYRA